MALKIFDAIVRHQIYLEGLKAGQFGTYLITSRAIERDVKARLIGLNYSTMDGLTKAQLRKLLADLRAVLNGHYSDYIVSLIAFLRKFMDADTDIIKSIYSQFGPGDTDDDKRHWAAFVAGLAPDKDRRWSAIANAPMPSNGAMLPAWINGLATLGTGSILLRINQGYANREKVADTLAAIVGTPEAKFKDGILNRTNNSAKAVINTALQHVAANNQAEIAALIWPTYRWISVMDGHTTQICRARNLNIYTYGKGPLPPAHTGCRSGTMPIVPGQTDEIPPAFIDFAERQSAALREDMFGSDEIPDEFPGSPALTLDEFAAKRERILQDA